MDVVGFLFFFFFFSKRKEKNLGKYENGMQKDQRGMGGYGSWHCGGQTEELLV